jgi:hypothetical protein
MIQCKDSVTSGMLDNRAIKISKHLHCPLGLPGEIGISPGQEVTAKGLCPPVTERLRRFGNNQGKMAKTGISP